MQIGISYVELLVTFIYRLHHFDYFRTFGSTIETSFHEIYLNEKFVVLCTVDRMRPQT